MAQKTNSDKGRPSGNKPMSGTAPTKVNDGNRPDDERLTKDYTYDDEELNESVRERHPNRNVDKGA